MGKPSKDKENTKKIYKKAKGKKGDNSRKLKSSKEKDRKINTLIKKIDAVKKKIKHFNVKSKKFSQEKKIVEYMKLYITLVKLSKEVKKFEKCG